MRAYGLVSLAFVSLPAAAGPFEKYDSVPGSVTISGTVEVPLYTTAWGTPIPCVEVQVGEKTFLFELGSATSQTWVSDKVAKAAGAKVKTENKKLVNTKGEDKGFKLGGKLTMATIESLKIGDLELHELPVTTTEPKREYDSGKDDIPDGLALDGILSLPALGIGWAVVPSKGVVRFAPADGAAALVSAVGGTAYDYHAIESFKFKYGKDDAGGLATPLVVSSVVSGQPSPETVLALEGFGAAVHPRLAGEATTGWYGDIRLVLTTVDIAGQSIQEQAAVVTALETYEGHAPTLPTAAIGSDALALFDIAADPVSHKLAFAPAPTQTRVDPTLRLIAEAEKGLTKPEPKPDDPPPKEGDEEWKPDAAVLSKLAALHMLRGELDRAIAFATQVRDQDVRSCDAWQNLGDQQLMASDLDGAAASYTQASQLYHAWWDLPVAQRQEEAETLGKLEEAERKAAEHYVQAAECYSADGSLAMTLAAKGDVAAVAELAKTKVDLDASLTTAAGTAQLAGGKPAEAQALYRQSKQLSRQLHGMPRLGLAITYAETGDWNTAKPLFARYFDEAPWDANAVLYWVDRTRTNEGQAAALDAIAKLAQRWPMNPVVGMVYWREAKRAASTADLARADEQMSRTWGRVLQMGTPYWNFGDYARHLVDAGKFDEAAKYVAMSEKQQPASPGTWFAKAELAAAKGNGADVTLALQKAALIDPANPISALVKAGKFGPTVAAPAPAPAPTPAPTPAPKK